MPDEALQAPSREVQLAGGLERVDVDRGLAEQVVGNLEGLVQRHRLGRIEHHQADGLLVEFGEGNVVKGHAVRAVLDDDLHGLGQLLVLPRGGAGVELADEGVDLLGGVVEEGHDPVLEQVDEPLLPALQEEFVGVGIEDGQVQFLLAIADVQRIADLDRIDGVHGGQKIRGRMSENAARAGHRPLQFFGLSAPVRSGGGSLLLAIRGRCS